MQFSRKEGVNISILDAGEAAPLIARAFEDGYLGERIIAIAKEIRNCAHEEAGRVLARWQRRRDARESRREGVVRADAPGDGFVGHEGPHPLLSAYTDTLSLPSDRRSRYTDHASLTLSTLSEAEAEERCHKALNVRLRAAVRFLLDL